MAMLTELAAPGMEGRRAGTAGNARARSWIVERMKAAGLTPFGETFESEFSFVPPTRENGPADTATIRGVNIAAVCRGTGIARRAMVITAHYDHIGIRDGAIYHGADDNASGVVTLLALARHCRMVPWRHDAIFVALDAEEMGRRGARAFVAGLTPSERARTAVNVNLDMVARGDKGELFVAGLRYTPTLIPVLEAVAARAPLNLVFGHDSGGGKDDWTTQSDHIAFHEAGIPFLYFGVEDHPDYHQPTDTPDKVKPTFFADAAVTILNAVTAVDAWILAE
jgi:Zn-dependent M28 family amino/carboxypeptidase